MTTNHDALREAFNAFLLEQQELHKHQHNHFHAARNEWARRTQSTQYEALAASNPEQASGEQEDDETPAPSLPPNQYAEFWERLPGHLIDNHEGEELTEELLQRAAADLYATFPELVESGLKPFGLLLLEERATTRQLTRALREATEAPTFMGEPVATPNAEPAAPVAAKPRCNYPECTRACGDAKGYCHKAAKPERPSGEQRANERMLHDFPALQQFHTKHALGPMLPPSCLCCGQQTHPISRPVSVKHMELPGIVICKQCKDAATPTAKPEPQAQAGEQP